MNVYFEIVYNSFCVCVFPYVMHRCSLDFLVMVIQLEELSDSLRLIDLGICLMIRMGCLKKCGGKWVYCSLFYKIQICLLLSLVLHLGNVCVCVCIYVSLVSNWFGAMPHFGISKILMAPVILNSYIFKILIAIHMKGA